MKLVTFRASVEASARLGVVQSDQVIDVGLLGAAFGEEFPTSMLDLIDLGPAGLAAVEDALVEADGRWPIGSALPIQNVTLLAPIPRPRKNIFGIGLNYVEHVAESSKSLDTSKDLPTQPVIFSKPPTTVIGPGAAIEHNKALTQQLDWEVELAVIIGRTARKVGEDTAMSHVFGYSVMIDISARDNRRAGQWIYSKGQDTFAPFGPCIVTADEIDDPQGLDLWLTVNGVEKQRSNTRHMLFKIPTLISDISMGMTLEPGDIIATGTPEGVGAGRTPQEWLW
ncbi:MAG TPA: FAA hydrolase family protein, partial [Rhodospirillaceae bacterium]|nr:FAA hydrolase family protein [Rhodospirillaceae bacterium]